MMNVLTLFEIIFSNLNKSIRCAEPLHYKR